MKSNLQLVQDEENILNEQKAMRNSIFNNECFECEGFGEIWNVSNYSECCYCEGTGEYLFKIKQSSK